MNRSLVVPAGCLCAFAALLAVLPGGDGRESAADSVLRGEVSTRAALDLAVPIGGQDLLPHAEAERMLTKLSGEYLRPWRQWENSPQRLYSRAAPRPIPSMSAEVALSAGETLESDSFVLATIDIRTGERLERVPCVVDRATRQVQLFAGGQWVSSDQWLETAPVPHSRRL